MKTAHTQANAYIKDAVEPFLKAVLAPLTEKGKKKGGRERGEENEEKKKEKRQG
jgi:hypothetical protein